MIEEYSGGSVGYYAVEISHPINEQSQPYVAECIDIIDALHMTPNEANAFKALWRRCAARTLGKSKRGYTDGLYDAEKVVFYGERLVQLEQLQRKADGVEQATLPLTRGAPWMPHPEGADLPTAPDAMVEVTFANGETAIESAGRFIWTSGIKRRITHWRPHMPA